MGLLWEKKPKHPKPICWMTRTFCLRKGVFSIKKTSQHDFLPSFAQPGCLGGLGEELRPRKAPSIPKSSASQAKAQDRSARVCKPGPCMDSLLPKLPPSTQNPEGRAQRDNLNATSPTCTTHRQESPTCFQASKVDLISSERTKTSKQPSKPWQNTYPITPAVHGENPPSSHPEQTQRLSSVPLLGN